MSYFSRRQFLIFLTLYFALRLFSYFFTPTTPLFAEHYLNELFTLAYLAVTAYCLLQKYPLGWYLVAGEIILGGGGGYFSFSGFSLRTGLLIISLSIYTLQNLKQKLEIGNCPARAGSRSREKLEIGALVITAALSSVIGLGSKHNLSNILSDIIPYCFLLYYFPLRDLIKNEKFRSIAFNMLAAAIIGNFLLIFYTFIVFSSGHNILQDYFYHWYRDVAGGKITALPYNYFRLTLNEHLLLVPILLWAFYEIITNHKKFWWLATPLIVILPFNLTRIYFLAVAVGALILLRKYNFKIWLKTMAVALVIFMSSLTVFHYTASGGRSFGWELLGLRLQSIATPQIEDSSLSRMLLLPKILEKIKSTPIFGTGLGDTVTVYSPVFKQEITTPHFDWGYLEIWAEMGLIGLFIWGLFLTKIFQKAKKQPLALSMLTALMVINLTSPALFHVLGIILLVFLFVIPTCLSGRQVTKEESLSNQQ